MTDIKKTKEIFPEVMIDLIGDHFLEIANHLREVQDMSPNDFQNVIKQLKIGTRKGYALAKIDRAFHNLGIPRERLRKLGWTKLALLSPYVNADNVEQLLSLAEQIRAHDLKLTLRGEEVDPEGRLIVLYLRKEELELLEEVLSAHGAVRYRPHAWYHKEEALMRALAKVQVEAS